MTRRSGAPERDEAAETPVSPPGRRIVVTGGAGFVGSHVVEALRERGDAVLALIRDPRRAGRIAATGAELVEDDLSDVMRLAGYLDGADGVIHAAGRYRVGIPKSERGAMWDANVGTTTRILDAADVARTPRIVYVSTVAVFGDTHGQVVEEAHRRDLAEGFLSWYDETKYGAHEVGLQRIRGGAPIVIVQPSQVYGPGDHTEIGERFEAAYRGHLRYRALDDLGLGFVHVRDLAAGIVAALDRGTLGESYILGGPNVRLGEATAVAARLGGKPLPPVRIPDALLRLTAPLGALTGRPNMREAVRSSAGRTFWASSAKAARELGFRPRSIEDGLRDTFEPA
ncbi:MAG: NAD-dependent epimerase/dehydratase family protein [Candidatus Limnocylindrales bacterium]